MRIGFIIPVLNAADHLAGVLAQIEEYGRSVVIEFTDSTVNESENNNGRSVDETWKIVEAFDSATFFSMGKVRDRCSAMNKGLNALQDADFIFVLRQADFILDIQGLMNEALSADVITARRFRFWNDFDHYVLGDKEEIGFRNFRRFGKLQYKRDPYAVSLPSGHALSEHNIKAVHMENVVANFEMVTSETKKEWMFCRERKEFIYFNYGEQAIKDLDLTDIKRPSPKLIDEKVSFLNLVPHPWKKHNGTFLNKLPTFPRVHFDEWMQCFGDDYVETFVAMPASAKPRVLGVNCPMLANQFKAEGWDFSDKLDGKFDMIVFIGSISDIDDVLKYLKEDGKIIAVDSPERVESPEYETMFLERSEELFSFAIMRRSENG